MSLLGALIDDLSRGLFREWLELSDVRMIDSAYCSARWREMILLNMSERPETLALPMMPSRLKILKWMSLRSIKLTDLKVIMGLDRCHFTALDTQWRHIISLSLMSMSNVSTIVNKCINLTSLSCRGSMVDDFPGVHKGILSALKAFQFVVGMKYTGTSQISLKYVLTNCTSLTTLVWCTYIYVDWKDLLSSTLKRLTSLTLRSCGDTVFILSACHYLEHLKVREISHTEDVCSIMNAVLAYRHRVTGRNIKCNLFIEVFASGWNFQELIFDGESFSGEYWDNNSELLKAKLFLK